MKILITGAAGSMGAKLVKNLKDKYELTLLDINGKQFENIQIVDLSRDVYSWKHLFTGVDIVVHLAGNSFHLAEWKDLIQPNVWAVQNLYEVCAMQKVKRVIFASSNHVLGGYEDFDPVPVLNSKTMPLSKTAYGSTKLFGEKLSHQYSKSHEIEMICVRFGWNISGMNSWPEEADDWLKKMWISDRDYIHLMDRCFVTSKLPGWSVINGVSVNKNSRWDLSEAKTLLGYHPQDNAFEFVC